MVLAASCWASVSSLISCCRASIWRVRRLIWSLDASPCAACEDADAGVGASERDGPPVPDQATASALMIAATTTNPRNVLTRGRGFAISSGAIGSGSRPNSWSNTSSLGMSGAALRSDIIYRNQLYLFPARAKQSSRPALAPRAVPTPQGATGPVENTAKPGGEKPATGVFAASVASLPRADGNK